MHVHICNINVTCVSFCKNPLVNNVLTTLHFYSSLSCLLFLTSYFISFCFVRTPWLLVVDIDDFTTFCLLTSLLTLCMDDFSPLLLFAFNSEIFSLVYFLIISNGLLFSSLKWDPLVFFARPVSATKNSFSFHLSGTLFICPSILNDKYAG